MRSPDIQVISQSLIDSMDSGALAEAPVSFSKSPGVLGPDPIGPFELRVWDQGIPSKVVEFTEAAFEILEGTAGVPLHEFFSDYSYLRLGGLRTPKLTGRLKYSPFPHVITPAMIAKCYDPSNLRALNLRAKGKIPVDLVNAFSEHIVTSLTKALAPMPKSTRLAFDDVDRKSIYLNYDDPYYSPHEDEFDNLILHLTKPGSIYFVGGKENNDPEKMFQTTAGMISLHSVSLSHARSTAPNDELGNYQPRMCANFKVYRHRQLALYRSARLLA